MIKYFGIIIFLLLLAVDRAIYRKEMRLLPLAARRLYLWYSVAIYVVFATAMLLYSTVTDFPTDRLMHLIIWIIWLFFLNAFPKIVYFALSRLGMLLRRPRSWRVVAVVLAAVVGLAMIWGATIGRSRIEVRPVTLEFARLPASFDGTRIALFADVHLGNMIHSHRQLNRLVYVINATRPDIVVFGGDMVNLKSTEFTPDIAAILARVQSRYGNFAVLGNHDLGIYVRDSLAHPFRENVDTIVSRFAQAGWQLLINQTKYISRGGDSISVPDSIAISGVSFPVDKRFAGRAGNLYPVDMDATFAGVPDSVFNIVISHTPDLWDEIAQTPHGDLTLSGHVHAMQFKLSFLGLRWSPAEWKFRNWSGLYRSGLAGAENGTASACAARREARSPQPATSATKYLYVNDGVGYVLYPMRIGTRPEVTLITLKRAAQ